MKTALYIITILAALVFLVYVLLADSVKSYTAKMPDHEWRERLENDRQQ